MKTEKVTIKQKKIMIHNISRYLLTLVALLAMTTGAWAEETATITLTSGQTVKTYEDVTLPWSTTADILKAVVTDIKFNINITAISGGDGKVVKYGNENFTVTGTFSGEATITVTYNMGSSATITVTAPAPVIEPGTVTLNDTKTEATMEMPASDVTVSYELVRDLTVGVDLNLFIDQQPVTRACIARVGNSSYQLQGNWQFAAIDKLDAQNPVSLTNGELVYTLKKKDGDGYVAVNTETDLAPGLWRLEATAKEDKPYDGTIYSADIELYAVYDLYLSPAQDENVSVTANDKAVSPDAEGKISEVESGKTVKLNVTNADYIIRKATVKGATVSYKVESQFTNGNNYGASTDLKTVLESTDLPVTIKLSDAISFPWNDESAKITSIELQAWGSDPAKLSEYSMDGKYVVNPGDVTITFNSLIGVTSDTAVLWVYFDHDGSGQTNQYEIKLSMNQ